jgi:hypothetical protein
MTLGCYCFMLWFVKPSKRLLDRPCFWIHIECMLDEFPTNPWHVWRTPGEDFPALMEELDERAFLCGIAGSMGWTRTFLESWVESKTWSGRDRPTSGSTLWSVSPLSRAYSTIMPNICAILLNSLSQVSDTSKLPLTMMTPFGPGIFSARYA